LSIGKPKALIKQEIFFNLEQELTA